VRCFGTLEGRGGDVCWKLDLMFEAYYGGCGAGLPIFPQSTGELCDLCLGIFTLFVGATKSACIAFLEFKSPHYISPLMSHSVTSRSRSIVVIESLNNHWHTRTVMRESFFSIAD